MKKIGQLAAETKNSTSTIAFGHYPLSFTYSEGLNDLINHALVYLNGHLHLAIKHLYARHSNGLLELELGDWKDNRRFDSHRRRGRRNLVFLSLLEKISSVDDRRRNFVLRRFSIRSVDLRGHLQSESGEIPNASRAFGTNSFQFAHSVSRRGKTFSFRKNFSPSSGF